MDYLFQDGGKPKKTKSKSSTKTKSTKSKSKTSTKTGSKTTKSKTTTKKSSSKKGGNFLGAVGDLVAPTGWGPFATAAGLLALDRADAALRRGKSTKNSVKKGGAPPPPIPKEGNEGFARFSKATKNAKVRKLIANYDNIYRNTPFFGKTPLDILLDFNNTIKYFNPQVDTTPEYRKQTWDTLNNALIYLKKLKEIDEDKFKEQFQLLQNSGIDYKKYNGNYKTINKSLDIKNYIKDILGISDL